jgi:hypothetical protein
VARTRTLDSSSLTRQAQQAGDRITRDVPSEYRRELKNIVDELRGRVDFVTKGQQPRTRTGYQSLEASALARQARHVLAQISRNIPDDKREGLQIIETLAARVEFASIGAPSSARSTRSTTSRTRTTSGRRRSGTTRRRTRTTTRSQTPRTTTRAESPRTPPRPESSQPSTS